MIYKCLCIKQPYASWIINGEKKLELRSWKTNYRGKILICASKTPDKKRDNCLGLPTGCTIGFVDLENVIEYKPKHLKLAKSLEFIDNYYAWVLNNPVKIENIPVKGMLGLFDPKLLGIRIDKIYKRL
jgi:hypothetical protein